MRDDGPVIQHNIWAAMLLITLFIIVFCFFGLADRAELFFAEGSTVEEVDGLILQPDHERWPSWGSFFDMRGIVAIILLSSLPSGIAAGVNRIVRDGNRTNSIFGSLGLNRRRWLTILSGVCSFWSIFILLLTVNFGVEIIGPPLSSFLELIGYIILTISIAVVIAPFTYPLVPHRIKFAGNGAVLERYLSKQWRYAQASLSAGLAIVVAGFVPTVLNTTEWVGFPGLALLVGTVLPPFLVASGFLAYRMHVLEVANRN